MSRIFLITVSAAAALWVGAAFAQDASTTPVMAPTLAPAKGGATLTVTSSAFKNGAVFPEMYTQNGQNISPPLPAKGGVFRHRTIEGGDTVNLG